MRSKPITPHLRNGINTRNKTLPPVTNSIEGADAGEAFETGDKASVLLRRYRREEVAHEIAELFGRFILELLALFSAQNVDLAAVFVARLTDNQATI